MSEGLRLHEDFRDLIAVFLRHHVEFVVVGAYAMAAHAVPRATGDIDVFVRASDENAARVVVALTEFGAPLAAHGVSEAVFAKPGQTYQMGLPPRRIDILTAIDGVTFDEAWGDRKMLSLEGLSVPFLGEASLRKNKAAAGRDKDLVDLRLLEKKNRAR
jgi:hypothetical protein